LFHDAKRGLLLIHLFYLYIIAGSRSLENF
jgi:hypothetical protein